MKLSLSLIGSLTLNLLVITESGFSQPQNAAFERQAIAPEGECFPRGHGRDLNQKQTVRVFNMAKTALVDERLREQFKLREGVTMAQAIAEFLEMEDLRPQTVEEYGERSSGDYVSQLREAVAPYADNPKPLFLKNLRIIPRQGIRQFSQRQWPWHLLVYVDEDQNIVIHEAFLDWLQRYKPDPKDFLLYLTEVLGHENVERSVDSHLAQDHEEAQRLFPLTLELENALIPPIPKTNDTIEIEKTFNDLHGLVEQLNPPEDLLANPLVRRYIISDVTRVLQPAAEVENKVHWHEGIVPTYGLLDGVDEGDLMLMELAPGQTGTLYSPNHERCSSVSIRARRGNREVIGHAHIFPRLGATAVSYDAYIQFQWLLHYLTDPAQNLTDIQIVLGMDSRLINFPPGMTIKKLEQEAEALGITVLKPSIKNLRTGGLLLDTFVTTKEVGFRIRNRKDDSAKRFISRTWQGDPLTPEANKIVRALTAGWPRFVPKPLNPTEVLRMRNYLENHFRSYLALALDGNLSLYERTMRGLLNHPRIEKWTRRQIERLFYEWIRALTGTQEPLRRYIDSAHAQALVVLPDLASWVQKPRSENGRGMRAMALAVAANRFGAGEFDRWFSILQDPVQIQKELRLLPKNLPAFAVDDRAKLVNDLSGTPGNILIWMDNVVEDVAYLPFARWILDQGHTITFIARDQEAYNDTTVASLSRLLSSREVIEFLGPERLSRVKVISAGAAARGTQREWVPSSVWELCRTAKVIISAGEGNGPALENLFPFYRFMIPKTPLESPGRELGTLVIESVNRDPARFSAPVAAARRLSEAS